MVARIKRGERPADVFGSTPEDPDSPAPTEAMTTGATRRRRLSAGPGLKMPTRNSQAQEMVFAPGIHAKDAVTPKLNINIEVSRNLSSRPQRHVAFSVRRSLSFSSKLQASRTQQDLSKAKFDFVSEQKLSGIRLSLCRRKEIPPKFLVHEEVWSPNQHGKPISRRVTCPTNLPVVAWTPQWYAVSKMCLMESRDKFLRDGGALRLQTGCTHLR
ncbi:hypothetical protein IWX49DRAFT_625575 [Phyllosticta citricarpa]